MGKTWETKLKILKMISKEKRTPMSLSKELGLAPSTITEHMASLERIGAVQRVDNPYVKKWKYYIANPNFDMNTLRPGIKPRVIYASAITAAIILLIAVGLLAFAAAPLQKILTFQITDPPNVPLGTQALIVTYSSLQAHIVGNNQSSWVTSNASGTLDLMALVNASTVMGSVKALQNQTVDRVRFKLTSAQIEIDNETYNMTLSNNEITANILGNSRLNTNSTVLMDFTPTVVTIYTNNSTLFVLVPSLRAVFVGRASRAAPTGYTAVLNSSERDRLGGSGVNISLTNANIISQGSLTNISVTVTNVGNGSVVLRHLFITGNPMVFVSENSSAGAHSGSCPAFYYLNSTMQKCMPQEISPACPPNTPNSPVIFLCSGLKVNQNACPYGYHFRASPPSCLLDNMTILNVSSANRSESTQARVDIDAAVNMPLQINARTSGSMLADAITAVVPSYGSAANSMLGVNSTASANTGFPLNNTLSHFDDSGQSYNAAAGENASESSSVAISTGHPFSGINGMLENTVGISAEGHVQSVAKESGGAYLEVHANGIAIPINLTEKLNGSEYSNLKNAMNVGMQIKKFENLNFIVSQNGTLTLPSISSESSFEAGNSGYLLQPSSSITLRFSGQILLGNGNLHVNFTPGYLYGIRVIGEEGVSASTSVKAS